ncbi:MAG: hypothetical protein ACE5JB_07135 [bacterium]
MLGILRDLYKKIYITEEVSREFGKSVEKWIEIKQVKDKKYMRILDNLIDLGVASTISLSLEIEDKILRLANEKLK